MKRFLASATFTAVLSLPAFSQIGIGTTSPHPGAALDITATDKAFLPPRLTDAQKNAIPNPVEGMTIYNTTVKCLELYRGNWWNMCTNKFSASIPTIQTVIGTSGHDQLNNNSTVATNDKGIVFTTYVTAADGTLGTLTYNGGSSDALVVKTDSLGTIQWQKLLGGTASDYLSNVIATSDGGFLVCGATTSSNSGTLTGLTNNGSADAWVIKLDANGNTSWQVLIGSTTDETVERVVQTQDGGYILASSVYDGVNGLTGKGDRDVWLVKINSTGVLQWQQQFGGSYDEYLADISATTDGGGIFIATSESSNTGDLTGFTNNGGQDIWIVKLSSTGSTDWQRLLGSSGYDFATQIRQTTDGGYLAIGTAGSSDGSVSGLGHAGCGDVWILKFSNTGTLQWQKLMGGNSCENVVRGVETAAGDFVVAANTQSTGGGTLTGITAYGNNDVYLFKISSTGSIVWQNLYGGTGGESAASMTLTADGGIMVTGNSSSSATGTFQNVTNQGNNDVFALKLDANGQVQWTNMWGGSSNETNYFSVERTSGYLMLNSTMSSNSGSLSGHTTNGNTDIWLFPINASGK